MKLLFIFINLYGLSQNAVVMSVQAVLGGTWIGQVSYRNGYVGLLVQHLLSLECLFHHRNVAS